MDSSAPATVCSYFTGIWGNSLTVFMWNKSFSYPRIWQLLLKLYFQHWVAIFPSKASKCCSFSFALTGSCSMSRPVDAVLSSPANWSMLLARPDAPCCWWMASVCLERTTEEKCIYMSSQTHYYMFKQHNEYRIVFSIHNEEKQKQWQQYLIKGFVTAVRAYIAYKLMAAQLLPFLIQHTALFV